MKRLRVILIFLLLGAVVNVAVAWGFAARAHTLQILYFAQGIRFGNDDYSNWVAKRKETLGTIRINSKWYTHPMFNNNRTLRNPKNISEILPPWAVHQMSPEFIIDDLFSADRHLLVSGWPYLSFWGMMSTHVSVAPVENESTGQTEISFSESPTIFKYAIDLQTLILGESDNTTPYGLLPCAPILWGFILNTLFYSALLWLILIIPLNLPSMIRHRRGLCTHCAYDLRGAEHEACPECGTEVRKVKPE